MRGTDRSLEGYWPSPWPGEDGGPRRTAAPTRGSGLDLQADEHLVAHTRFALACTMAVWRDPGELYLQGHSLPTGGAVGGAADTTGWVERIDPESLEPIHRSPDLPAGPFWPGGLAAHANGSLYITQGRWCHRLAADCSVLAARELPRDAAYNSLVILPDGHLVMKDFAGGTGVHALPPGRRGSELVVLEPEGLEVVHRFELPEGSIARLSMAADDDAPDGAVYVIGDHHALRLHWRPAEARLVLDESWVVDYRRFDGQTFGWDVVVDGDSAWFLDNGEGSTNFGPSFRGKGVDSTSPLHLIRIPLTAGGEPGAQAAPPEPSFLDVCDQPGGLIANPPAIDAERRIAVGYDSAHSVLRAWRFGAAGLPAAPLWTRTDDHAGHLIRYPDTGELVAGDFDHDANTDQVVVLDIETGVERGRVATTSPLQGVVFPCVGAGRDLYAITMASITRVRVEPDAS